MGEEVEPNLDFWPDSGGGGVTAGATTRLELLEGRCGDITESREELLLTLC